MFDAQKIAELANLETPFYYYDLALLKETLTHAKSSADRRGFHLHYALKANFNDRILEIIRDYGYGADCVSGNEVKKAISMGFSAKQIVFAGVGKSDQEMSYALSQDIFAFNVESVQELEVLDALAGTLGKKASIALRINPNVDAQTHHYITTGLDENKFGIMEWELENCIEVLEQCPNLQLEGIHFHVGSQITEMSVFRNLCSKVNHWNKWFASKGHPLRVLNVGGGLGINYEEPDASAFPDFEAYFSVFDEFLERTSDQEVHFELGRALVAQCGSLVSRVLYVKRGQKKNFLILDAGMTELIRPALYQAYHKIEYVGVLDGTSPKTANNNEIYDVVGPICESSDTFGTDVALPICQRGDAVAIRSAGAYGEVMASRYNLRDEIRYVYHDTDS